MPRHRIERKTIGNTEVIGVKNLVPHNGRTLLSLAFYTISDKETESVSETAILRNWLSEEIISIAEKAEFTVEAVYGGYDTSEFNPEISTDVLFVLRKG